MKTKAPLYLNLASLFIILASLDAGTAITYFLVAGEIPVLHVTLSASTMLIVYSVLLGAILFFAIYSRVSSSRALHTQLKLKQLPKRRFHQIA